MFCEIGFDFFGNDETSFLRLYLFLLFHEVREKKIRKSEKVISWLGSLNRKVRL